MTEEVNLSMNLPPYKLAFIIDDEVVDVLHTDERLAAIFLSNPLIIDVTEKIIADAASVQVGFIYDQDSESFTRAETNNVQEDQNV
jgi:hypothetical protein